MDCFSSSGPNRMRAPASSVIAMLGEERVHYDIPPSTGGENFADMMQVVPGCAGLIGNGADGATLSPRLHAPHYDFNHEAILYGIVYWVGIVQQELGSSG